MEVEDWKNNSARAAAEFVKTGMAVGLGSGTTVTHLIGVLAEQNPKAIFVPSSISTQNLASQLGLKLGSLEDHPELDLTIDGADEVNSNFDMIKGKGGALTREKIVAGAAKRVLIMVDRTKLVKRLGERAPVPVEVLTFEHKYTMLKLSKLNGKQILRLTNGGTPFVTDNGNYIVDVKFPQVSRPAELERKINAVPGVVENGLFVGVADEVFVGHEGGYDRLKSKKDFANFLSKG